MDRWEELKQILIDGGSKIIREGDMSTMPRIRNRSLIQIGRELWANVYGGANAGGSAGDTDYGRMNEPDSIVRGEDRKRTPANRILT